MNPLVRRAKATEATMSKFSGQAFAWGSIDCVKMGAFHLRQLGRKVRLAGVGQYKSAKAASSALKRKGFDSIIDAVDAQGLERIAPAATLLGDIVAFPGEHGLDALVIVAGNANVIGFHEGSDALVVFTPTGDALKDAIAWKVL